MDDINECLELMDEAQKSVSLETDERKPMHDYTSDIFTMLREMCKYSEGMSVDYLVLKKRVVARGYTESELGDTIQNYLRMNVLMREDNIITLIEG